MKIECECGNIDRIKTNDMKIFDTNVGELESGTFEFHGEHAEVWITCKKCQKVIWL